MPRPRSEEREKPLVKERDKLDRIHERFTYADTHPSWKKIREQRKTDMRHVAGDPWEPKEKLEREKNMRPTPACDELGQYLNQVTNEVRSNPRALKFSPVGFGANDKTAEFYADKAREIEYRSHAQQHYTRAFQNMVEGSYGYVKVRTEFVTDQPGNPQTLHSAFDKRLVIEGVPDPDTVYPDPDFLDSTGRDWQWLFEIEKLTKSEFKRQYKNAEIQDFSPELVKYSNGWISGSGDTATIRIASYWEIEKITKELCAYSVKNPQTGADEVYEFFTKEDEELIRLLMEAGGQKIDEREVEDPKVTQYRTNGVEILKATPWLGKRIPYVGMFGKMIWLDLGTGPELMILSMTRLARNPNMLLAYYLACEAEMIGMTPKVPWWVWKGSLDKKNAIKTQEANHKPVAFIEVDTKLGATGTDTPSLPQRIPFEPPIQAIEIAKESARRSIQAAMGLTPLPTSAQKRNEKSGVALRQIEESGQRGAYHFIDAYDMGICSVGELIEDLIPKYYDRAGETPVLDNQKRPKNVFINAKDVPDNTALPEGSLLSIEGLHAVTIDVGPDFASERQMSSDFVDAFVGSPFFQGLMATQPQMAMEIMALLIKLKNLGPIGEEIADLLDPNDEEQQMVSAQKYQQDIQLGNQIIQQLQGQIKELQDEKQAKIVELQGRAEIAKQQDETKLLIAMQQIDQKMREAQLEADTDIRLAKMEEAMKMLELHVSAQQQSADRAAGVMTKGAELEQKTADGERARAVTVREGDESRAAEAREGAESRAQEARENEATRAATSRENAAARASADKNAAEDRKIKAKAAAKPQPAGRA